MNQPKVPCRGVLVGAILLSASLAAAGDGTAANPWRNVGPAYTWTYQGPITSIYQDVRVTASLGGANDLTQFWAFNAGFATPGTGFYIGLQRKGWVITTPTLKSAHFSLFSNGDASSFKLLDSSHCALSADSSDPATGVSCAIPYGWAQGVAYRLTVYVTENVTAPSWCPGGVTPCTVYAGYVAPASNLSASKQIGAWSVRPSVYGRVGNASSFLENFNVTHTAGCSATGTVAGDFVIPFKVNGTSSYPISSASGWDRYEDGVLVCVWAWNDWLLSKVSY
jgi:hypothetical protein